MTKLATFTRTGISGKKYNFNVYSKDTEFNEIGAVYFITRRAKNVEGEFRHTPIYIGQTGDLSVRFDNHHRLDCFKRHNWNCICVHRDDNESSRLKKESDLIDAYDPPCNRE